MAPKRDPQAYARGLEMVSITLRTPTNVVESEAQAELYRNGINDIIQRFTDPTLHGFRSCRDPLTKKHFRLKLKVEGRFEIELIIQMSNLYAIGIRSKVLFYEFEGQTRIGLPTFEISVSYASDSRHANISPRKVIQAVTLLSKLHLEAGVEYDKDQVQKCLNTLYWYFLEACRYKIIFKELCRYFTAVDWGQEKSKTTQQHNLTKNWDKLCSVARKAQEINAGDSYVLVMTDEMKEETGIIKYGDLKRIVLTLIWVKVTEEKTNQKKHQKGKGKEKVAGPSRA